MRGAIVMLAALAACAPAPEPETVVADTCVTGVVANMGVETQSQPVLRAQEGGLVHLTGHGAAEVLQLSGALVTVCGARSDAFLDVRSFALIEVDGMAAYSGTLSAEGGAYALDRPGGRVPLAEVPPALSAQLGQQVWVAGEWAGERFVVKSYGVIRGG